MKDLKINPIPWKAWLDKQHILLWGCCVEGMNPTPAFSWTKCVLQRVQLHYIFVSMCNTYHCSCRQLLTAGLIIHNTDSYLQWASLSFKFIILLISRANSFICTATQTDHHIALTTCLLGYLLNCSGLNLLY